MGSEHNAIGDPFYRGVDDLTARTTPPQLRVNRALVQALIESVSGLPEDLFRLIVPLAREILSVCPHGGFQFLPRHRFQHCKDFERSPFRQCRFKTASTTCFQYAV